MVGRDRHWLAPHLVGAGRATPKILSAISTTLARSGSLRRLPYPALARRGTRTDRLGLVRQAAPSSACEITGQFPGRHAEDAKVVLGCPASVVYRLRLCGWPRADRWDADVQMIADTLDTDRGRLAALLRQLGTSS